MPAEQRIQFVVKARDLRSGFFEQGVEIAAAGAVHQLDGEGEPGLVDGGKINQFSELFEIGRLWIKGLALKRSDDRRLKVPILPDESREVCLNLFGDFGCRGRAVVRGKLQALIFS